MNRVLWGVLIIIMILGVGIGGVVWFYGGESERVSEQVEPVEDEKVKAESGPFSEKRLIDADEWEPRQIDFTAEIPAYELPLEIEEIVNIQAVMREFDLTERELALLQQNGFVTVSTPADIADSEVRFASDPARDSGYPKDDFAAFYTEIENRDLPIFVTTDSLLHFYHLFFGSTLMRIERDVFYDDLWRMSKELLEDSIDAYHNSSGDLQQAARNNAAYLSVALELLSPDEDQVITEELLREEHCVAGISEDHCLQILQGLAGRDESSFEYFEEKELERYQFETPDFVKDLVEEELELIAEAVEPAASPIFHYLEDYTQYQPRGHYTTSEKLKNYFLAMMWYGRATALLEGDPELEEGEARCVGGAEGIISEPDAKVQTLQALLLADQFSGNQDIRERWDRMYAVTAFFAGFSDDLGPYEYLSALEEVLPSEWDREDLEIKYPDIKEELRRTTYQPKIYSGLGGCELFPGCPPLSREDLEELRVQARDLLSQTKGFRLMGQRFTIDSWIFSELVSPYSGEYTGEAGEKPFTYVEAEPDGCPGVREVRGFPRGLDLMALLGSDRARDILDELGDSSYCGYDRQFDELQQEIDSLTRGDWTENLYMSWIHTLQSLLGEHGEGYQTFMQTEAWRDKNLNTALGSWAQLRHDTILYVKQSYTMAELGGFPPVPPPDGYVEPMPEFYNRLYDLSEMTAYGLEKLLPQEDLKRLNIKNSLERFSDTLDRLLAISKKELKNEPLSDDEYEFIKNFGSISEGLIAGISGGDLDPDIYKSSLVADVHTEGNTEQVLEQGTGHIDSLLVAYKLPDGDIALGVGPVFSYYEFKQPMEDRLTNEQWREMLETDPPAKPEWVGSFQDR